jgi:hypothetical protein
MIVAIAIAVDQMGHDQRRAAEGQSAVVHTQEALQPAPVGPPPVAIGKFAGFRGRVYPDLTPIHFKAAVIAGLSIGASF